MDRILVTGGAGFIGSCFIRQILGDGTTQVLNLDKLTYAGHPESIPNPPETRYRFVRGGIEDRELVAATLQSFQPDVVVNFAAESHVDRSIDSPHEFLQTNVDGTVHLLEQCRMYFQQQEVRHRFRFVQISTDEVYGSLGPVGQFDIHSPLQPNSPYAASKAAGDMFVRSFHRTYGLPTLIVRCSNTYGPYQLPEKLIPLMILSAANGERLPVYGDGAQVREWLHVEDTCRAIQSACQLGRIGQIYNVGGGDQHCNLEVVQQICDLVDRFQGTSGSRSLIEFVADRPGHDRRYSMASDRVRSEFDWAPMVPFDQGLQQVVRWYLSDDPWLHAVQSNQQLRQRRGLAPASKVDTPASDGRT